MVLQNEGKIIGVSMQEPDVNYFKVTNEAINQPLKTASDLFTFGDNNGSVIGAFIAVLVVIAFMIGIVILIYKLRKA